MAYAELADLRARAGKVGVAWDLDTLPGDPDLDRLLDMAASEIDALLAARGYTVPLTDVTAQEALRSLNTAGALLKALGATMPADTTAADVRELRRDARTEWNDGLKALATGEAGVVAYLESLAGSPPGASDFWDENPEYGQPGTPFTDPGVTNPYLAPTVCRTDTF
jgi:hypothetical protein